MAGIVPKGCAGVWRQQLDVCSVFAVWGGAGDICSQPARAELVGDSGSPPWSRVDTSSPSYGAEGILQGSLQPCKLYILKIFLALSLNRGSRRKALWELLLYGGGGNRKSAHRHSTLPKQGTNPRWPIRAFLVMSQRRQAGPKQCSKQQLISNEYVRRGTAPGSCSSQKYVPATQQ